MIDLPVLFRPSESGMRRVSEHWYEVSDRDPVSIAIFRRHYSCENKDADHERYGFEGIGESFSLITADADALFTWRRQAIHDGGETGACCTVFRNESPMRSSDLVREAVEIARRRWPGERLFTYVNASKVESSNPGYCFLKAGWSRLKRTSSKGLRILEMTTLTADEIAAMLSAYQMRWSNEAELQGLIEYLLSERGIEFSREVRLSAADRPDFMIGSIVLEVKIKGSHASVMRQLARYALHASVSEIVLVTTRRQHAMPTSINGKPVHVVYLLSL